MGEPQNMNSSIKNKVSIREYLLGRVTDESALRELEDLLFTDEEFFDEVALVEDELINDYVFGRLDSDDRTSFEKTLRNNRERKMGIDLATALKEKAAVTVKKPEKAGFVEAIGGFFKQPLYANGFSIAVPRYLAGFAVILIGITIFSVVLLTRRPATGDLADLQALYRERRQTDTRISGFDYTPKAVTRSGGVSEEEEEKLILIESPLIAAVKNDPNAKTYHDLGIFYLIKGKGAFDKAIRNLDLAVKADPSNAAYHNDLGSAYFEMAKASGDTGNRFKNAFSAVDEFSRALELQPDMLEALFNKSLALQMSGGASGEAMESWRLYLQKDQTSKWAEEARKNLEKLEKLQSSLKTKEQVLNEFLAAYLNKDKDGGELAWKINCQTRDVFFGVWLPDQLSRRYAAAKLRNDTAQEKESLAAIEYIGNLERDKNADFFVSDLAVELGRATAATTPKLIEAQNTFDAGLVQMQKVNYPDAIALFEKSGQLFRGSGFALGGRMSDYWKMQGFKGNIVPKEALRLGEDLIAFANSKNYRWFGACVRYFTGATFYLKSEPSRAMNSYKYALETSKALGDTQLEQRAGVSIMETFTGNGEYQKALDYRFEKADDLYYNGKLSTWRNSYMPADLMVKLKLYRAAASFASEALAVAKALSIKDVLEDSLILAEEARTDSGNFDDALTLANESRAMIELSADGSHKLRKQADVMLRIANLKVRLGRHEEALGDFRSAILIYEKVPDLKIDEYAAHKGLLLCFKALGRSAELAAEMGTVLSLADKLRGELMEDASRQAFFDNEQVVYDVAIEDSMDRGDTLEAFARAERSKARSLLDLIEHEETIDELQKQVAEPMSPDIIRSKVPGDVQILEYSLVENRLVAWVVSNNNVRAIDKKIDSAQLNSSIEKLARLERDRSGSDSARQKVAAELYRILVAPLSELLDPAKRLVIVPDKSLFYVPFASLVNENGQFLIQQFSLSYAPSSTIYISRSEMNAVLSKNSNSRVLSVGDPAFDRDAYPTLADLDSAETEAREVAAISPNSPPVLTGKDATKEKFMRSLDNVGIVHFAGHYLADPEIPSHSKLIFAKDGPDSDLQMSEIAEEDLSHLKLVVLSACDTGVENVLGGEGPISASRAFLAAGVTVVVASQWKVDSEATANLMVAFHKNRLEKGLSSPDALRQAQLDMLRDPKSPYASPYYWAAFSVIGGTER
jgi:CHAT domain-containing protein